MIGDFDDYSTRDTPAAALAEALARMPHVLPDGTLEPGYTIRDIAFNLLASLDPEWTLAPKNWEEFRKAHGWPTPISMRRAAVGLDIFTPARYGDILRWVAAACDAALGPQP